MASTICSSIFSTGFRVFMEPWGTYATSFHLTFCRSRGLRVRRSLPLSSTWPLSMYRGATMRFSTVSTTVDLPHPDSPAMPRISFSYTANETLSVMLMFPGDGPHGDVQALHLEQ